MAYRDTVIVDRSPQTADPSLEKTTNSRSPDIQEVNEDTRQINIIYHFHNCGTVNMDSFNARGVRMENCGNNVPQVTYHRPKIISNEKILHSQSHAVSNGSQNATNPPTAPTEIAKSDSDPSNVHLQSKILSQPQSPQPISPSHNVKYLEQLLDSSLATVAVIQFSGNTLADALTPRAYDALKTLCALAALNAPTSSSQSRGSVIPTRFDIQASNDCPSNHSPPLPNPSLAVPHNGRLH